MDTIWSHDCFCYIPAQKLLNQATSQFSNCLETDIITDNSDLLPSLGQDNLQLHFYYLLHVWKVQDMDHENLYSDFVHSLINKFFH